MRRRWLRSGANQPALGQRWRARGRWFVLSDAAATTASQTVSSLTNFGAAAMALRAGDLAAFGRFAVAFQVAQVVLVAAQGGLGDAVLSLGSVRESGAPMARFHDGAARVGVLGGLVVGALVAAAGLVTGGETGRLLVVVALGCPALVAQYVLRASFFSQRRPTAALAADLVWLAVVVAAALGDVTGVWAMSPGAYLAVWLAGAAVSGAPSLWRALVSGRDASETFRKRAGSQSVRLAAEALLGRGVYIVSLLEVRWFLGDAAAGTFAAAVLVLSPMSVVHTSLSSLYLPRLAAREGVHVPPFRAMATISVLAGTATLAWAALVAAAQFLPVGLGPFDLSVNGIGSGLFIATVARFCALAAWRGPLVALRVADAAGSSLRARVTGVGAQVSFPVAGLVSGSLATGAAGLAVGTWVGAVAAWRAWWRLRSDPAVRTRA